MKPMPWWKRWPNCVRLALTGLKYRLARLLHRAGLLPSERRASTDTMGDWKRLQAMADDPKPRLVRSPEGPYADLIRRVRLYAQNGAKALGPLLDRPLPETSEQISLRVSECESLCTDDDSDQMLDAITPWTRSCLEALHAAYNSPWTVVDGEVFEVVTEKATPEEVV